MISKKDLHKYQKSASKRIDKNKKSALLADMGLGKTIIVLTAIVAVKERRLKKSKRPLRHVIFAPPTVVINVWESEAEKWEHTKDLKILPVIGSIQKRDKLLKQHADVYVISHSLWGWFAKSHNAGGIPFDWLILDESHNYKDPSSIRFNFANQQAQAIKRVTLLTGTPSSKGYHNLWSQCHMLDGGKRLGRSYDEFLSRWFYVNSERHITRLKDKESMIEIRKAVKDIMFRYDKADYLKEIEIHSPIIPCSLTPNLRKQYDILYEDFVLHLEGGTIAAFNAALRKSKLSQFVNGSVIDIDGDALHVHDIKLRAALEIRNNSDRNLLIAYTSVADRERLLKSIKGSIHYRGKKTDTDRWNENKNSGMTYVCHMESIGAGINLQKGGSEAIVYALPIGRRDLLDQFIARLQRQGQEDVVRIYYLMMKDTVDEDIYKSLQKDAYQQKEFLKSLKEKK